MKLTKYEIRKGSTVIADATEKNGGFVAPGAGVHDPIDFPALVTYARGHGYRLCPRYAA